MDQPQSPSQDSQADSLPHIQADTTYDDPVADAMEWVQSQREAGKDPLNGEPGEPGEPGESEPGKPGDASEDIRSDEPPAEPEERERKVPEDKPVEPTLEDKPKQSALANFHRQQQQFEAQRREFQKEKAELEGFRRTLENAKTDRIAALEAMGYKDVKSFLEGLAEDGGRMTPERRELQELKRWRETQEKAAAEQKAQAEEQKQQQHLQRQLDDIRGQVQSKLKSDSYSSRLINVPGADESVMQEMDRIATETGELPSVTDAIESVERKFRDNLKALSDNPEVRKHFEEILKSSRSAPSPSKSRGKISTIGSETRSPGLARSEEYVPSADGEREIQEALAFLEKRKARR